MPHDPNDQTKDVVWGYEASSGERVTWEMWGVRGLASERSSRQKSYADVRRKPMEFDVGNMVMLKVSPRKGIIRFEVPRDENLVIPLEEIQLDDKLHFIEEPVEIMDREVKQLNQSRIPIVKVSWNSRRGSKFTWEREDFFMRKYLHLVPSKKRGHGDNRAPGRRSRKDMRM
ncbi:hypothetical protein Tco_1062628 [Tanacetum coccineum]